MKDMGVEGQIPLRFAKEGIKLTKGGVLSSIRPSEAMILQMYLA
jgi:hypothetical protein